MRKNRIESVEYYLLTGILSRCFAEKIFSFMQNGGELPELAADLLPFF
jgi:hypothetical protein